LPAAALDDALLGQVGLALDAKRALACRTAESRIHNAAVRIDETSRLLDQGVTLRRRLRRQRELLRRRIDSQRELLDALLQVEQALDKEDSGLPALNAWSVKMPLPRDPSCAMIARRTVEGYAREFVPGAVDEAVLIASELVTNAFLHGEGEIVLRLQRRGDRFRIEVEDEGGDPNIRIVDAAERGSGGHGLKVVQQVSSAWGATDGVGHVWAELKIAHSPQTWS
jgi:anti-sigma regulatory factor (Ser/Thr protein kinase)